jgi:hypothetical protein
MLDLLQLEATRSTPEIVFNPTSHELSIRGQSYPENSFKFYEPILGWVESYLQDIDDEFVEIRVCLPYINTSSSKCIMMLLEKFNKAYHDGKKLNLTWYCNEDNESEIECAEEFKEDLDMPFQIISQKEE